MARYFNVNIRVMDADLSVWEEKYIGRYRVHRLEGKQIFKQGHPLRFGNGDHAAHVKLAGSGQNSTPTTCVNVNGSPHGRATVYLLYTHIADAIKNTVA